MKSLHSTSPLAELLEPRIAPAGLVTFLDVDGDMAFIKTSKGTSESLLSAIDFVNVFVAKRVLEIDLSKAADEFAGSDLTVGVTKRGLNGDGRVNVGLIDAAASDGAAAMGDGQGLALGKVSVKGDLGQINANSIGSLSVVSLGRIGTAAQGANGGNVSIVAGAIGSVVAAGGIFDVTIEAESIAKLSAAERVEKLNLDISGTLGSATFAGIAVEVHVAANQAGTLLFKGGLGGAQLGPDISSIQITDQLGSFRSLGNVHDTIISATSLTNLMIKGSVLGGSLADAGRIDIGAGGLKKAMIGGDLIGGNEDNSGSITVAGALGSLVIRGNVIGGLAHGTGSITADGGIGTLAIGGSFLSAPVIQDIFINGASLIESGKSIGKLTIGGDMRGGVISNTIENPQTTSAANMLAIRAAGDIEVLTIRGSVVQFEVGGTTSNSIGEIAAGGSIGKLTVGGSMSADKLGYLLTITAAGGNAPVDGKWVAIQSIVVGGSLVNVKIEAGEANFHTGGVDNVDSSIGSITVKGSVENAVVAAGKSGATDQFPSIQARIASIVIGGSVSGAKGGFFAQEIGSFKIAGSFLELIPGAMNDDFTPFMYSGAKLTETV